VAPCAGRRFGGAQVRWSAGDSPTPGVAGTLSASWCARHAAGGRPRCH